MTKLVAAILIILLYAPTSVGILRFTKCMYSADNTDQKSFCICKLESMVLAESVDTNTSQLNAITFSPNELIFESSLNRTINSIDFIDVLRYKNQLNFFTPQPYSSVCFHPPAV